MVWRERQLNLDHDIVPFWEGLKQHEFHLFCCRRCGAAYWPYAYCRNHDDIPALEEMEWRPTSGRGRVFVFNVVHLVTHPAYADEVPYVLAMVELEEGPLFPTRIVGCDPSEVSIGLPVEVQYEDVPSIGHTLPLFRTRRG